MPIVDMLVNQIMNDPRYKGNQVMQNAFQMYREGRNKELGQYTQNVCSEQGKDINQMLNQAKNMIGKM